MVVNLKQKREFIMWLHDNVNFSRRDVYWLLNYLLNHKAILEQVVFVEDAEATPRGLKVTAASLGDQNEPLELYLQQRTFTDPEQVFHELRMNWKQQLYLEVVFPSSWENPQYLAVLEDNPFHPWNEHLDKESGKRLKAALKTEELQQHREQLLDQIDQALESGDQLEFVRLTEDLKGNQSTEVTN